MCTKKKGCFVSPTQDTSEAESTEVFASDPRDEPRFPGIFISEAMCDPLLVKKNKKPEEADKEEEEEEEEDATS